MPWDRTTIVSAAPPRRTGDGTALAVPDPRVVRAGLRAITAALKTRRSLADLHDEIVRSLEAVLDGARVELCLPGAPMPSSELTFALELDDANVGTLVVHADARTLASGVREALDLLATPLAVALGHRERDVHSGARDDARIDALCGIPNRLAFDERFGDVVADFARCGVPIAIALLDIDFFKAYNDAYGHLGGDRALRDVAAILADRCAASGGFCARYGGEEFVMLFADKTLAEGTDIVRSILERLETANFEHEQSTLGRISASVGIAAAMPHDDAREVSDLVGRADRALFRAKRLGRNRICSGTFVSGGIAVARCVARRDEGPFVASPTFGRENDVSRILAALRHTRMITLVGPPGIGKSRLLALFAETPRARDDRHTVFVESEILRAGTDLANAIASAFDITIETGDALDAVTNYLDERDALLVLDYDHEVGAEAVRHLCEHLIARTANVQIVTNARTPLGISGERWIVVPPLDDAATIDQLVFLSGEERATCARIVPYFGGNPGAIARAAGYIAGVGEERLLRRLIERGTPFATVVDVEAYLRYAGRFEA